MQNKVVITFDDGYIDNFENAARLLEEYEMPATFFINSNFIKGKLKFSDDERLKGMSKLQIKKLSENSLFTFGGHTADHVKCSNILTKSEFKKQILNDKLFIESIIGKNIDFFAYPNGQGEDISYFVIKELPKIGYSAACSTFYRNFNTRKDIYHLNRIMIWPHFSSKDLFKSINGDFNYIYFVHSIKSFIFSIFNLKKTFFKF